MFGLRRSDIDAILKTLVRYEEVEEAILFGSRAMGNFKPGSDVDIALKGILSPDTVMEIGIELNERLPLPYKFDVLAYSAQLPGPLREDIDQYGKSFYKRTPKLD